VGTRRGVNSRRSLPSIIKFENFEEARIGYETFLKE